MKKRIFALFLTLLMVLSLVPVSLAAEDAWMSFYVSPSGSDDANGSKSAPFKTIQRAQEEVRKNNKNMQGNIVVNLMPGRYELTEQLDFKLADAGTNGYEVIWQGTDPNNLPVISGAKEVKGTWVEGENGIWHTQAEDVDFARTMFVNGKQAVRAKSSKKVFGDAEYTEKVDYVHPYRGAQDTIYAGFYASKDKIGLYENPEDIELHSTMIFRTAMFHVTDIVQDPTRDNWVIVKLGEYWNEYRNAGNDQWIPERGFVVENAYELLDMPGEFYFNRRTKRLSYIPYEGEDMNSAEVLIPTIEQLMHVHGGNKNNKLENLRFKNIQFSHARSHQFQDSDSASGQGDYHYLQEATEGTSKFAINMEWCKNVTFDSCLFYGIEPGCIFMKWGTEQCNVIGSVFAEIGGHGVMMGSISQNLTADMGTTIETDGPADAAFGGSFITSYPISGSAGYARDQISLFRKDSSKTRGGDGWYSDPLLTEEDGTPWVTVEMLSKVKLESIEFTFPSRSTEVHRRNFEIQVSNDRYFNEYETVASFTDPVDYRMKVDVESDKEWRYIRFKKTALEDFALNGCFAWSYDVMPQTNEEVPREIEVSNCYFTRVGQQNWVAVPLFLMYTRDCKIIHNTIYDVPYSGMSVGWGWWYTDNDTAGGNEILYNRIDDATKSANDGGCLYIFGEQNNSTKRSQIRGNYFSNATSGWGTALYMDSGNCGIDVYDNVALNVRDAISQNNSYGEITVKNFYTGDSTLRTFNQVPNNGSGIYEDTSMFYRDNKDLFDMDDPIQYVYSDLPVEVARIMGEAGIEDEWEWILDRVPVGADVQKTILLGPDATEAEFIKAIYGWRPGYGMELEVGMAEHILNNGTFGTLPWNFKSETKVALTNALAAHKEMPSREEDTQQGHLLDQELVKDGIYNAYKMVVHPSYDEMIKYCEAFAKSATTAEYRQQDIDTFKKEVAEITGKTYESRGDKAAAARELEIAYDKLWNTNRVPQLVEVAVENGTSKVDLANKKVTVYMPFGVTATDVVPFFFTGPNTKVVADTSKIDRSTGVAIVPLKNTKSNKYDSWKVEFVPYDAKGVTGRISLDPADWTAGNVNTTYHNDPGYITLDPYFLPSVYKKLVNGNISFALYAPRMDLAEGYEIVFGAKTCDDLDLGAYLAKDTYYSLELRNQDLVLYKAKAGKREAHMCVYDCGFNYGEFNEFEITTAEHGGLNRVTVKLNGSVVMDTLVDEPIGQEGYFGIFNPNIPVRVK